MLGIDKRLIVPETSRWITAGVVTGVGNVLLSLALYATLGLAIDGLLRGEPVFERFFPWLVALLAAKLFAGWFFRYAQYRASSQTKLTIRDSVYAHALRMGPAVLDRKRTGELVNIAVDGMDWIELFYGVYFVQFIVGMATPIILCVYIGLVDWVVGLSLIVAIPLTPLFLGVLSRQFRKVSEKYADVNNQQSAAFLDALQGMTTLKMFNLGTKRGEAMYAANEQQRVVTMKLLFVNQIMILLVDFGFALGTTLVLTVVALLRLDAGLLTAGQVVALVLASAEFSKPLALIGQFFFAGAIGREFAKKIIAFISEKPGVADPEGAASPAGPIRGALSFKDVSFSYPGAAKPAVAAFSLDIRPGETVALIGHSGSGKTTVANLVLRTLAPSAGEIAIDGHAASRVPLDWVRAQIALVPQDPYLFYGTIADNLRLAKPDATDAELWAAAEAANIADFIRRSPAGLDTLVGERGTSLSGGQIQRLAIARALLKAAPIIVLDEPTSQIDLETESVIHEALERLTKDRTVILIAHRLKTVQSADRIVVMDAGRIVEQGPPADLAARGGVYARMVGTTRAMEQGRLAAAGGAA
ncbi:MAG: ABC transporter ATP-binding protein [Chromatiales bacterium]|nr:ABC transporter ATP-binding protein [Chromatiales bacterium]